MMYGKIRPALGYSLQEMSRKDGLPKDLQSAWTSILEIIDPRGVIQKLNKSSSNDGAQDGEESKTA